MKNKIHNWLKNRKTWQKVLIGMAVFPFCPVILVIAVFAIAGMWVFNCMLGLTEPDA